MSLDVAVSLRLGYTSKARLRSLLPVLVHEKTVGLM